jgi:uncharacterized protein
VLLPLFVSEDHVIARTDLGRELQALAPAFVSRATGRAFLGYLEAQRLGLTGERHAARTRELSARHGYDTKYAMHALRIAHQGLELLRTGRISLPVAEPARSALREVRAGEVPLDGVLRRLDAATAQLEQASQDAALPAKPDSAAVDAYLVGAYLRAWEEGPTA